MQDTRVSIRASAKPSRADQDAPTPEAKSMRRCQHDQRERPSTEVDRQIAMVMDLNKCLGCQTCTVSCKKLWNQDEGTDYAYWNNVETLPGTGYPKHWSEIGGRDDKGGVVNAARSQMSIPSTVGPGTSTTTRFTDSVRAARRA